MSEFDDPELRSRLSQLSGPFPDDNAAFATVQRRVMRAKRRRAAAWSGGAALGILIIGGVYTAGNLHDDGALRPSTTGGTIEIPDSTTAASTVDSTASTVFLPVGTSSIAPGPTTPSGTNPGANPTVTSTPGTSTPATSPPTNPPTSPPTSAPAAPTTATFSGDGGTITVRLQNGTLSMVGAPHPSPGFDITDQRDEADRVEVRFRSADRSTRIRVLVVNGHMSPIIEEEGS